MSDWERPAVEQTIKFATSVETLEEAFAFVMGQLSEVDDLLNIEIKAFFSSADDFKKKRFTVVISGMSEFPAYAPESMS